jgi:hypothetical protein
MSELEDEIEGREFDWFAIDCEGQIALICTAGKGPVPREVRMNIPVYDSITEKFETPNWGTENIWRDYGGLGFFVFDWKLHGGPYVKRTGPTRKMEIKLKEEILSVEGIVKMEVDFSVVEQISDKEIGM